MSPQLPSQPVTLPPELWEKVFLHLTPERILKLREVNCSFRDLTDGSPEAQYIIDLHASGLEVGYPDPSLTLADRRAQLDRYRSHWDSLQWVEHKSLPLPSHKNRVVQGGVICLVLYGGFGELTADYRFIQLPSVLRSIPLKEWTLHGLPHDPGKLGLLPEEDLLVVCTLMDLGGPFLIQLLRMSDGQPHPSAFSPTIEPPDSWKTWTKQVAQVQLTSSRLAVTFLTSSDVSRFVVWDWKTGVKHVDVVHRSQSAQFVDEYRMFGVSEAMDPDSRSLVTLLDTSAPVEDPQKPREIEFGLDPEEWFDRIDLVKGKYTQGTRWQGSPFRTDRKRHVLYLDPVSYLSCCIAPSVPGLVIDYGSICAIASENKTASCIPWDLWKHKVVSLNQDVEFAATFLKPVGPRVLGIIQEPPQGPSLHSFDFTPGVCRSAEEIDSDTPFDDEPRHTINYAKLTDKFPEGHSVKWVFSEDNVLAFTGLFPDRPDVLEMWTF